VRPIFRLAASLLAAIGLCTAVGTAQPSPTVVRVGGVQTDDITPLVYAIRTGMFRRAGLEVVAIPANSGAATAAAVLSGSYEIGKSSLLSLMNAHLRRLPLTVIAAGVVHDTHNPFAKLCVAADAPYKNGKDFDGKTIAVSALNDLSQVAIDAWVDKSGGDAASIRYVELPVSAMPAAVAEHRVDGAFILYPVLADALASGKVRAVVAAYDAIAPYFVLSAWFTTTNYASTHPDIIRTFVRVMYAAAAYTNKHHAETAPMMSELTKTPLAIYETMARVDAATSTNPKDWQPPIDAAAKYHVIPQAFPAKDFLWPG
jgi:NitT/TauT family transport system substrate-binding protein